MHQGEELKSIAAKQKNIGKFAQQMGIHRDTLYKMYPRKELLPKYVEILRTMGFNITPASNTKFYNTSGYPQKRGSGISPPSANGSGKHIAKSPNSERSYPHIESEGEPEMDEIIGLSLNELLKLQEQGNDGRYSRLVTKLIILNKDIASLERENKSLKESQTRDSESHQREVKNLMDYIETLKRKKK